eukprot:6471304-Amphidinium_carterae.1
MAEQMQSQYAEVSLCTETKLSSFTKTVHSLHSAPNHRIHGCLVELTSKAVSASDTFGCCSGLELH